MLAGALLISALLPQLHAAAATDCLYHWGSRTMTVTVNDPGSSPTLDVVSDKLRVDGVICGGANRWSVDTIVVNDASGGDVGVVVDLSQGRFGPGSTGEPDTSDEIEFAVDLGGGTADWLRITGTSSDVVEQTTEGINLNATEPEPKDVDVTVAGVDSVELVGVSTPPPTECDYHWGSRTMTVTVMEPGSPPTLDVVSDKLRVDGVICGGANRWSVDIINVNDATGGDVGVIVDLTKGPFRPGSTGEPGASDEIEFAVDLGVGTADWLRITGTSSDVVEQTTEGINLNASENDPKDIDMTVAGTESVELVGVSAPPPPSPFDCVYHWGTRSMTVTINEPGTAPTLDVVSDKLRVDGVICGGANRWSVDTITVNDASGGDAGLIVDLTQGRFGPGSTAEPDTSDEIEFAVDLGGGSADWLRITGDPSDVVEQTPEGINLNASENAPKDIDMTVAGTESVELVGVSIAAPAGSLPVGCSYNSSTKTVQVSINDVGSAPLVKMVGDQIHVGGSQCGTATRWNTNTVSVTDNSGGTVGVNIELGTI
ncbi:MAG: hypothetical protein ACRDJP_01725, partial [Actinomycetota bacterium]